MSNRLTAIHELGISVLFVVGCASVEPFEGVPDGGGVLTLGSGGMPSTAAAGQPGAAGMGSGGESGGAPGDIPSGGAPSGGSTDAAGGGASGSGTSGSGTCYVSGCPGCILAKNSLFGTPCCTPAGKCGCQAVFTMTCM
jgi:hypothetical protein